MAAQKVAFDPSVIQEFAENLYAQAAQVVFLYTTYGVAIGCASFLVGALLLDASEDSAVWILILGGVLGASIGYPAGRSKSFQLRLDAQKALCKVQIEKNTRPAA